MGKKAKSSKGAAKAKERKIDKTTLPPPPKPLTEEVRHYPIRLPYGRIRYYSTCALMDTSIFFEARVPHMVMESSISLALKKQNNGRSSPFFCFALKLSWMNPIGWISKTFG